ncbi:MAG: OmpH family outer membrane protein [Candidatus Spyradosoma sp.]
MLKKITLILGMLALAAGSVFAEAKNVVTIDLNKVLETFSKTVAVKQEVESAAKEAEALQKIRIDEFQKLREKLNAAVSAAESARNNPTLSKKAAADAEAEAKKLYGEVVKAEQSLRQSQQETRELLQNQFAQKTNVILEQDVLPRIKEIAKARGAEIVLNARVGIIFAEASVDITQALIDRLEADFPSPKKDAAPAAK